MNECEYRALIMINNERKLQYFEKNMSQYCSVQHQSYTHYTGIKPRSLRWEDGNCLHYNTACMAVFQWINYHYEQKTVQITIIVPLSLASSTRIISFKSGRGDLLITLHTVRNKVDQASLWNTITIEVVGNSAGYCFDLHLKSFTAHSLRLNFMGNYSVAIAFIAHNCIKLHKSIIKQHIFLHYTKATEQNPLDKPPQAVMLSAPMA